VIHSRFFHPRIYFLTFALIFLSALTSSVFAEEPQLEWSSEDYARVTADFNGDGQVDFLYQNRTKGEPNILRLSALEANGNEPISYHLIPVESFFGEIPLDATHRLLVAGDFNGDGYADVLAFKNSDIEDNTGEAGYLFLGSSGGNQF